MRNFEPFCCATQFFWTFRNLVIVSFFGKSLQQSYGSGSSDAATVSINYGNNNNFCNNIANNQVTQQNTNTITNTANNNMMMSVVIITNTVNNNNNANINNNVNGPLCQFNDNIVYYAAPAYSYPSYDYPPSYAPLLLNYDVPPPAYQPNILYANYAPSYGGYSGSRAPPSFGYYMPGVYYPNRRR